MFDLLLPLPLPLPLLFIFLFLFLLRPLLTTLEFSFLFIQERTR